MFSVLAVPATPSLLRVNSWMSGTSRHAAIAVSVLVIHIAFIYVLYSGLLMRTTEPVVPTFLMAELIELPNPKIELSQPAPPPGQSLPRQAPARQPLPEKTVIAKAPAVVAPLPAAISDPMPAANAPAGSVVPQSAPAPMAAAAAVAAPAGVTTAAPTAPAGAVASASVQLPLSDADYLQNPKPGYPPISRRMNEQGTTLMRVYIAADGLPQRAEIAKSSGYARLDTAAAATVMRWRYVPGKRGGVAEAMSVTVPIVWTLE